MVTADRQPPGHVLAEGPGGMPGVLANGFQGGAVIGQLRPSPRHQRMKSHPLTTGSSRLKRLGNPRRLLAHGSRHHQRRTIFVLKRELDVVTIVRLVPLYFNHACYREWLL